MFCAPIIKVFTILWKHYTGGLFWPPADVTGGLNNLPVQDVSSIVKTLLLHKTCLYILGCIAYIFNRGVDTS